MLSVIIPVYNGEDYLKETIESVLAQSRRPDEMIVVDDGSTDGTAKVVAQFAGQVQYLHQANQGPGAARNAGLRASRGDLIAFVDSDDTWEPSKLEIQAAALQADPKLGLVFCHMDQFISPDLSPEEAAKLVCDPTAKPSPLISCLLARRTAFDTVGLLRTDTSSDFVDWYLRAQEHGIPERMLDQLLVHRRLHRGNLTRRSPNVRRDYLQVIKASLDRRRARSHEKHRPHAELRAEQSSVYGT